MMQSNEQLTGRGGFMLIMTKNQQSTSWPTMDATDEKIVVFFWLGKLAGWSLPEETRQPRKSNKYRFTARRGRYDDSGGSHVRQS